MQMEVGDALAIGLKGMGVFNANLVGKQETEGGVYKAPILRVWVTEQQKWCWKWRSSETVGEGRMRCVVSSCEV